jgi:hypothetical protein
MLLDSERFEWWIVGAPHRLVNLAHGVGQWLLGQAVLIGGAGYRDGDGGRNGT